MAKAHITTCCVSCLGSWQNVYEIQRFFYEMDIIRKSWMHRSHSLQSWMNLYCIWREQSSVKFVHENRRWYAHVRKYRLKLIMTKRVSTWPYLQSIKCWRQSSLPRVQTTHWLWAMKTKHSPRIMKTIRSQPYKICKRSTMRRMYSMGWRYHISSCAIRLREPEVYSFRQ